MVNVLLATDFEKASDAAFDFCLAMAADVPMRIVVGHVFKPQAKEHLSRAQRELFRQNEMRRYESRLVRSSRLYPHATAPDLVHHSEVITAVEEGSVSEGLKGLASQYDCSLIILGVKKNPGIMKRMFGQISQSLIYQSEPDILLIPETGEYHAPAEQCICLSLYDEEEQILQQKLESTGLFPKLEANSVDVHGVRSDWGALNELDCDIMAIALDSNHLDRIDRTSLVHWLYDHASKPLMLLR